MFGRDGTQRLISPSLELNWQVSATANAVRLLFVPDAAGEQQAGVQPNSCTMGNTYYFFSDGTSQNNATGVAPAPPAGTTLVGTQRVLQSNWSSVCATASATSPLFPISRTWDESQKDRSTVSGLGFRHEVGRVMAEIGYTCNSNGHTSVTYDYNSAALGVNATQEALAGSGFPDLVFEQHLAEASAVVPIVRLCRCACSTGTSAPRSATGTTTASSRTRCRPTTRRTWISGRSDTKFISSECCSGTSCDLAHTVTRSPRRPRRAETLDAPVYEPGAGFAGAPGTEHSTRRACRLHYLSWTRSGSCGTTSRSAGDPEGERAARRVLRQTAPRVQGRQAQERSDGAHAGEDQQPAAPGTGRPPRQSNTGAARRAELAADRTRSRLVPSRGNAAVPACIGCHLPNGVGAPRYPRLAGQRQAYVVLQLMNFKQGTRTNDRAHVMRSIAANLSEEEMAAIAQYSRQPLARLVRLG